MAAAGAWRSSPTAPRSCRASAAAARPARRSRCWFATRTGRTGRTRCTSSRRRRPGRPAPTAPRWCGRGPVTPTSPARSNTITTTSATCSSAPARARPRPASPPAPIARQLLLAVGCEITSHITGIGDVVVAAPAPSCRSTRRRPSRRKRRCAASDAALEQQMIGGDRCRQGSRRHARRLVRSDRPQRAGRPRQLRAVGSQARWPAGPGADVDSGDQGRVDRRRRRRRAASGLAGPRRDRRRSDGRAPASR